MAEFAELKTKQKATWGMGEYDVVAQGLHPAQDHVIRAVRPRPGQSVLDVATGTGNTALKARELGAEVTGLDFAPEMLAVARRKAQALGHLDIRFDEGDAGKLPYRDGEFDLVLSTCGHMFAPDQEQVGREMVRVTKPGGRIAFMAWTPDSGVGRLFQVMNRHIPPPAGVPSPFAWGVRDNVSRLLPGTTNLHFETGDCADFYPNAEAAARVYREKYGPTVRSFSVVGDAPKQDALWKDLVQFYQGYVTPVDGKVRWGREYLLTVATKA